MINQSSRFSKRKLAVQYGAKEITLMQCAAMAVYRQRTGRVVLPAPEEAVALMRELRAQRA